MNTQKEARFSLETERNKSKEVDKTTWKLCSAVQWQLNRLTLPRQILCKAQTTLITDTKGQE